MRKDAGRLPLKPLYPPGKSRMRMRVGTAEWCYCTMDYARSLYRSHKTSLEQWDKVVREIEEARAFEVIPEGRPYGDLDALLKAEIGVDRAESRRQVAARQTTTERAAPFKGARTDLDDSSMSTQASRASRNGIGLQSQKRLDRLARERPDLRERIIAGELSIHGAWIEAGWAVPTIQVPRDPEKAAEALKRHFAGDRLAALIEELSRVG